MATKIDPTSDAIVLSYKDPGDGRDAGEAAARDLTEADIARIAYRRELAPIANEIGQPIDHEDPDGPRHERPDPMKPDTKIVTAVVDDLLATGLYKRARSSKPDAPGEAPVQPNVASNAPETPVPGPEGEKE